MSVTSSTVPVAADPIEPEIPAAAGQVRPARLGEELPIFCEKCGYALHGLPQQRCDRCDILQYKCPECGHHQPINTLRPAFQKMLGRIRAFGLGLWVLFKINFFGWLLFGWFGMGVEWPYRFQSVPIYQQVPAAQPGTVGPMPPAPQPTWRYSIVRRPIDFEVGMAFGLFALAFGMFGRMFLLRFRRGWAVGAVLGALVLMAASLGAWMRATVDVRSHVQYVEPLGSDWHALLLLTALTVLFGAIVVWPIWLALVHLFLPSRTGASLLEWQRSLSQPKPAWERAGPALGRD